MVQQTFIDEFQRNHPQVQLIAVTKYTDIAGVAQFVAAGVTHFGENRADAFVPKKLAFPTMTWHFIGHLQTNKVKQVIDHIDVLHSLDRLSLAIEIQKRATNVIPCFVQVKTTSDEKFGMMVNEVEPFLQAIALMDKIRVIGVMTMAEHTEDETLIRASFQQTKQLQLQHQLPSVSMGMSNDYRIAIEEGSTHVRLGRILYQGDNE
jgi:pyridoxal phosphate enzyme (YggS family)